MRTGSIETPDVLTAPAPVETSKRSLSIGLPKSSGANEKRFPLTPEGAALLVDMGLKILVEREAGRSIHYTDAAYARAGARICERNETLRADIVIHLEPLPESDIRKMKRGAVLLSLLSLCRQNKRIIKALTEMKICAIALDLITDKRDNRPFADILEEIDGRASIAIAASLLADAIHGKGILLGGVAGVVPCEVLIIGSGIAATAAARSASGTGALVRIFDNDVYRLRAATHDLGPCAVGSALHPKVLHNALRSADIVIYTDINDTFVIDSDIVADMKRGVVIFDLTGDCGKAFPSLPCVDLVDAVPEITTARCCYVNAGSAVPRTVAMALSNTLLTLIRDILACEGADNTVKLLPGIRKAVYTFVGKTVNPDIAAIAGTRSVDINLFINLS